MNGGYDEGYQTCSCFWGQEPGSLVKRLVAKLGSVSGLHVLDVGCGEGKNTVFLARIGAYVSAVDISEAALKNAVRTWPTSSNVEWHLADIRKFTLKPGAFDIVLLYGILHCLETREAIRDVIDRVQAATGTGGYHLVCAFNDRKQDLTAHPGFIPTLLSHSDYLEFYRAWEIIEESDSDLWEIHPHNLIRHMHSMTRFIGYKKESE